MKTQETLNSILESKADAALNEASNRLFALELERDAIKARIAQLEEAVGMAMKMRRDWLEMSNEGYAAAYEAFVEHNDGEWDKIAKAMGQAPGLIGTQGQ